MSVGVPIEAKEAMRHAAILERENSTLRNEIYRLEKVNRNLMGHSAQLTQQSQSDVRYQSLETDLAEAKSKIFNLESENANLVDEKLQLRQQLALLTADNEILSQDIITLSTLVNELGGNPGLPVGDATDVDPNTAVFQGGIVNGTGAEPATHHDQGPRKEDAQYFTPENRLSLGLPDPQFCEANYRQLLSLVDSLKREIVEIHSCCHDPSNIKNILSAAAERSAQKAAPDATQALTVKITELENKLCVAESRVTELEVLLADYEKQEAAYVKMAAEIDDTRKTLALTESKLREYDGLKSEYGILQDKLMAVDRALTENLDAYKNLDNEYQMTLQRLHAASEMAERAGLLEEALRESEIKSARTAQLLELAQSELVRYQFGEKHTLETAEAEIETLKTSLTAKASQLKEITEQFEHLMEVKKKQDAKLNEVYDLRKRFEYMKERFEPMQKEVEKLRNKEKEYSRILSHLDNGASKNDERLKEIELRYKRELNQKDSLIATLKDEKLKLNEEIITLRTSIHVRDEDVRRTRLSLLGASQMPIAGQRYASDQTQAIQIGQQRPHSSKGPAAVDKSGITMSDLALQQPAQSANPLLSSVGAGSARQSAMKSANLASSMAGGVIPPMLRSSTIIGSRGYVGSAALSGIARMPSMNSQPE